MATPFPSGIVPSLWMIRMVALTVGLFSVRPTFGQTPVNFEQQIRPILTTHCSQCHGPEIQKSSLRLDAKHGAMKGGDGGPVIVAGHSADSELLRRITSSDKYERMPPDGAALTNSEIDLLQRWIDTGADWPETDYDRQAARDPRLDHWAWQPVANAIPPELAARDLEQLPEGWINEGAVHDKLNPLDRFILARLHGHQLQPSGLADRRTLIRRLSFDLLGLPPSPEQIEAFVSSTSPTATEELVDRFLASPHYGERWAQHWLDCSLCRHPWLRARPAARSCMALSRLGNSGFQQGYAV